MCGRLVRDRDEEGSDRDESGDTSITMAVRHYVKWECVLDFELWTDQIETGKTPIKPCIPIKPPPLFANLLNPPCITTTLSPIQRWGAGRGSEDSSASRPRRKGVPI
jgi:hypothetical protein